MSFSCMAGETNNFMTNKDWLILLFISFINHKLIKPNNVTESA